jgi:hypothetical protein
MELKCNIDGPASTPEIALENERIRFDLLKRLRAIKIGSFTVDHGSHSKHFAAKTICLEAAQEIERLREGLELIEREPLNAEYMARNILDGLPAYHDTMMECEVDCKCKVGADDTALKPYNAAFEPRRHGNNRKHGALSSASARKACYALLRKISLHNSTQSEQIPGRFSSPCIRCFTSVSFR